MSRLLLLILLGTVPKVANAQLDQVASLLRPLQQRPAHERGWRGGHPGLTTIKHAMRRWVDSRINRLPEQGDERTLQTSLNQQLRQAGLFCVSGQVFNCAEAIGFVGELELWRTGPFLVLKTRLSIECGFDDSVYLYRKGTRGWERIWESEENDYAKETYRPRMIESVLVSESSGEFDYLVLSLGTGTGCASVWQHVYHRLHRVTLNKNQVLLDEGEVGNMGSGQPVWGRVTRDSALVVYSTYSVDPARLTRTIIRHYTIRGDQVMRTDPVARSPIEFVDGWLSGSWPESANWTEPNSAEQLRTAYDALHKGEHAVGGEFNYFPLHCKEHPDLWQVEFQSYRNGSSTYFWVRWRPPLTFRMVSAGPQPWADCTEQDREAAEGSDLLVIGGRGR